jgi:hypothetical protein
VLEYESHKFSIGIATAESVIVFTSRDIVEHQELEGSYEAV